MSPIQAEAIELLRAARGHHPSPGQKQRVRARLLQHRVARRAAVLRPAVVVVAVVLFGAAASAAVGRHWIARTIQTLVVPRAPVAEVKAPAPHGARGHRARAGGSLAVGATAAAASELETAADVTVSGTSLSPSTPPAGKARLGGTRAGDSHRRRADVAAGTGFGPRAEGSEAPSRAPIVGSQSIERSRGNRPGEDSEIVFDAMRVLRQEQRPTRAAEMLDDYLRRHPSGVLAEEALALSVEAALARRDPRTRELIDRYLTRFPSGHFRATVEASRLRLSPP
ncbi:MAG: hypothetical protein ABUS79_06860 [Pseudomonadota bacterium]